MTWTLLDPDCRTPGGQPAGRTIVDLLGNDGGATGVHYSDQWGAATGFQAFSRVNPGAMTVTPGRRLGWPDLFARIRAEAGAKEVRVYDAGCGFGGILDSLLTDPTPPGLRYLGADIHGALDAIRVPAGADPDQVTLMRWDISHPVPVAERFDYVVCRSTIHHTPDPAATFRSLAGVLAPGGTLAISAYRRKSRPREALDDALRAEISGMPVEQAKQVVHEFTLLGRDIRRSDAMVTIDQDLPFLRIAAGTYRIHDFIYMCFMKNFYNESFGEKYSDVVNFDWYHPPFAYRYDMEELRGWFEEAGLEVTHADSIDVQHYMEGRKA